MDEWREKWQSNSSLWINLHLIWICWNLKAPIQPPPVQPKERCGSKFKEGIGIPSMTGTPSLTPATNQNQNFTASLIHIWWVHAVVPVKHVCVCQTVAWKHLQAYNLSVNGGGVPPSATICFSSCTTLLTNSRDTQNDKQLT